MNRTLVEWFIRGTIIVWLLFDAWLGPHGGPTESQVLQYWGKSYCSFAWIMGALGGHWFLGTKVVNYDIWMCGFLVLGALLAWDFLWWRTPPSVVFAPIRSPFIWYFVGLVCGLIFWPQRNVDSPL